MSRLMVWSEHRTYVITFLHLPLLWDHPAYSPCGKTGFSFYLRLLHYLRAWDQSTHSCHLYYLSKDVSFLSQIAIILLLVCSSSWGFWGKVRSLTQTLSPFCSQVIIGSSFLKMKEKLMQNFASSYLLSLEINQTWVSWILAGQSHHHVLAGWHCHLSPSFTMSHHVLLTRDSLFWMLRRGMQYLKGTRTLSWKENWLRMSWTL